MPRAYILQLWFFFFFFSTPNLWGHWTDLNQTWTHIYLWLLFEEFGSNPPGIYSWLAGGKTPLFGTDFEFWWNISLQRNIISTIGKKLVDLKRLPYMSPKFDELWSTNGWEWLVSFARPLNFCIGRHSQPYRMDVIQQTADKLWHVLYSGTSLQSRTTECRAGSRWALPFI